MASVWLSFSLLTYSATVLSSVADTEARIVVSSRRVAQLQQPFMLQMEECLYDN